MRFYDRFIARNNFAFNLTAIKELIEEGMRGIKPGDWAKCVEYGMSGVPILYVEIYVLYIEIFMD